MTTEQLVANVRLLAHELGCASNIPDDRRTHHAECWRVHRSCRDRLAATTLVTLRDELDAARAREAKLRAALERQPCASDPAWENPCRARTSDPTKMCRRCAALAEGEPLR